MTVKKRSGHRRLALILVFSMIAVLVLAFVGIRHRRVETHETLAKKINGTWFQKSIAMPALSLEQSNHKSFTNTNFNGHITLLFFGFSNCPYVCPTTLSDLNSMMVGLQKAGVKTLPQVVMVSVDPARDSVKRMYEYVTAFNPAFIGLRTSMQNTLQLAHNMHISFAKVVPAGQPASHYMVTHTASLFVIGPHGQQKAMLSYPHSPASLVHDYQTMLKKIQKTEHLDA